MDLDDTLRDRLSAAATTTTTRPLRAASTVRRSAERHRARRRGAAAVVVVATAAVAVALGTSLGPQLLSAPPAQDPTPSVTEEVTPPPTTDPSPTTPPTQTETEPVGPPPLTEGEAQEGVAGLRFVPEDDWEADVDYPIIADTPQNRWVALGCDEPRPLPSAALASRILSKGGPEAGQARQVVVFADADAAATAFGDLRAQLRACHATPRVSVFDTQEQTITMVGGQLELGDESFWVGEKLVITADSAAPEMVGREMFWSEATTYVLDDNVVTVLLDPAAQDSGRQTFVETSSAEWEQFAPSYEGLRRS